MARKKQGVTICKYPGCNYKIYWNSKLKRHIKSVHEKVKDFNCEVCDRSFRCNFSLKRHSLTHKKNKGSDRKKATFQQKLDVSSSLNKHDIATVVESETIMSKQDSPSQINSTASSKPTAIVKPQSEMKVEETTNEENKSDLVTDDKPKKKPLPPKPWLKKKRKANPSTKQTTNDDESSTFAPAPASTGNGYNLDFLDKLDEPNFNPFATKSSVVNDGEQLSVSKPAAGGGYNLDFLDKADLDDPNFNPFETKTKVVLDNEDSSSSPILPTSTSPGKTQKVEAYLDDPNSNPFETKSKVVLDNDSNSSKTAPTSGQGKTPQKVETEETSLPSDLPALELCEPPPETETGPVPPRINSKEKFVKKDSTPEFEAAEQQIFDDDISFQVSNISDLKEHLFNDNDLEEPYHEKDLTEPSFLLSATNRSTEATTGNGNSRLDSTMSLETSSSLTLAQSPPCLSILKDTQRANNFVKNSQNEPPEPENAILQPTKRDTKQKIRSEKVREEMARNELFYQSQLLEMDKRLHQKEKEIQLVDQEVQQLKQEAKNLDHGNLEMMKVVKEYERAISEVIADRERERVCHVSFRQSFTRICLKFEIKTNIMVRLMLPYMYFLISKA